MFLRRYQQDSQPLLVEMSQPEMLLCGCPRNLTLWLITNVCWLFQLRHLKGQGTRSLSILEMMKVFLEDDLGLDGPDACGSS